MPLNGHYNVVDKHQGAVLLLLELTYIPVRLGDCYERVDIPGVGGMEVVAIRRHYDYVRKTRPSVIYLDIGTNDLSSPRCDVLADNLLLCLLAEQVSRCAACHNRRVDAAC